MGLPLHAFVRPSQAAVVANVLLSTIQGADYYL